MKLFEFEAKNIFQKYGIPTPKGKVVTTPKDAESAAKEIGKPVVLKSQILVAGRGKAGGIKPASNPEEAYQIASKMLGSLIKGLRVESLLVEEKLDIVDEYYASVTVDRSARSYVVLASTEGGVDIEEVAEKSPEKIVRLNVDPLYGFAEFHARKIVKKLGFGGKDLRTFSNIIYSLYKITMDYDAELVESNPLVKISDGSFVAADARIIINDDALFRHKEFSERAFLEYGEREAEARRHGLSYVDLTGNIGCLVNGAGLAMATMDLIKTFGGEPANFLDIGGGARAEIIKEGVKILLSKPDVKVVLVNILGGITRCDEVARGILEALRETGVKRPLIVRLVGTREEEGRKILEDAGINVFKDVEEAVREAVKTVRG
ncbi:MAG: ADP-forming succinate--CoA ligase subunit beta [Candidatus Hecatellales archaeon]|nr:MAG: ADP-forming succinate--CoA ligase subunit beta [Candidatus Hecatellales archaeon]